MKHNRVFTPSGEEGRAGMKHTPEDTLTHLPGNDGNHQHGRTHVGFFPTLPVNHCAPAPSANSSERVSVSWSKPKSERKPSGRGPTRSRLE